MEIGEYVKVFLPGESPWVKVLAVNGPMIQGRVDNKLFHEMPLEDQRTFLGEHFGTAEPLPRLHDFKQGDVVWFERRGEPECWQPVDLH